MEVHRIMGPAYLEAVYHECLEIEFGSCNIPYSSQPKMEMYYRGTSSGNIISQIFLFMTKLL
jgi:GxxExxY protein